MPVSFTLWQWIVAPEMLGRVAGATRVVAYASIPVASLAAGGLEQAVHNMRLAIRPGALIRCGVGIAGLRTSLMSGRESRIPGTAPEAARDHVGHSPGDRPKTPAGSWRLRACRGETRPVRLGYQELQESWAAA